MNARRRNELELKAQAWDDLIASHERPVSAGMGYVPWSSRQILERQERIEQALAVPEVAEPIHTAMCTRASMMPNSEPLCIGYHCPECGLPCSSQGHGAPEGCIHARAAHEQHVQAQGGTWDERFQKRP